MTEVRRHTRRTASGRTTSVRQHHRETGGPGGADLGREREAPEQEPGAAYVGSMGAQPMADVAGADFWDEDDAPPEGDWWADDDDEPGWGGNYAAPGAQVGVQARDIQGPLTVSMGSDSMTVAGAGRRTPSSSGMPGRVTPVQSGGANVASGSDMIGVQVGQGHWRRTRRSDEHTAVERRMFGTGTPEGAAAFDRGADLREVHNWTGAMDDAGRIPDPDNPANAWFMDTMKPAEKQACRDKRAQLGAEFRGA